jgi:ubiquinone/menaquinone biosynthesis C-methylase UbiE
MATVIDIEERMTDPSLSWQYVLGTTEAEHDRLMRQAARLAPHTGALFREAGLTAGHRVLDIGSGVGDVALLAARIVGSQGEIVGIDRDGAALAIARERAKASGLQNVRFVEADVSQFAADKPFDAIVGRLTLQFVPRPVEILATLASALRPGGVMIFQESNWEALLSQVAHLPLRKRCCELIYEAFKRSGANMDMGRSFLRDFPEIGFPKPQLRLEVPIADDPETRRWVYDLVCTVYPRFASFGLSDAPLGDLSTLSQRLEAELTSTNSYAACIGLTGAWSRKPL